jgi:uncharacterized protein YndB with AHSA1/START domain
MRTVSVTKSIHQEVTIKASAKKVFDALTDAKQFQRVFGRRAGGNRRPGRRQLFLLRRAH